MKVTYDKRAQSIYIKISDVPSSFGVVDHTEELVANTVLVDYLSSGEVYGIDGYYCWGKSIEGGKS